MSGEEGRYDKERRIGDERLKDEVMTCYAASCGLCRRNCPIYDVTGRMVHSSTGKNRIIRGYLEGKIEPSQELAEAVFTCTLCGNCDVMCAVPNTEHFIAMRQELVEKGFFVESLDAVSRNVEETGSIYAQSMAEPRPGKVTVYAGCRWGYRANALRRILAVLELAGMEPRILDEVCCGYPLRVFGFKDRYDANRGRLVKVLEGQEEILTLCPTCTVELVEGNELPARHAMEAMVERIGDVEVRHPLDAVVTYHDSCHNARYMNVVDEPRDLLRHIGATIVEMPNHGVHTTCCGGGGGLVSTRSDLAAEVGKARVEEAVATGATILTTDCPTCFSNLREATQELGNPIKVALIWDLLLRALK
ncbi:MAG: (Fe-S)-binding protein [Thermoplasmata archaeon]|nr:(Fe-S)-binding protein [Thermoplasmata archaeon]